MGKADPAGIDGSGRGRRRGLSVMLHWTGQKHGRTEINLVNIVYNTKTNGVAAFVSTSGLFLPNQNSNNRK